MSALESSIDNLTAEHAALAEKLELIDQQYRVERPTIVAQLTQLAKALSALTGKPVAGAKTSGAGRRPMSEAGKAAIKAGLDRARAAKAAAKEAAEKPQPEPEASLSSPVSAPAASEATSATVAKGPGLVGRNPSRGR